MNKKLLFLFALTTRLICAYGQSTADGVRPRYNFPDSVKITIHASYNQVNGFHKWLFGKNFRNEWATEVKLPLIRVSQVYGGLSPLKYGGGMETKSIRMQDRTGKEWVLRSVEKIPDKLVPVNLRGTFAVDWVDDEYSGQHPYSALIVPPLAEAGGVPHANPIIGVLAPDSSLGTFGRDFAGRVVLLEEREPTGPSESTIKLLRDLNADHNNKIDGDEFLRARLLDLLIGDWDRHEDQWRWTARMVGKDKVYTAVPRDRDQALHVIQGVFPSIAALPWVDPVLGDFNGKVVSAKYSPLFKSNFLSGYPSAQFSHAQYTHIVSEFVKAETDEVLEAGLRRLPPEEYQLRHQELLAKFKQRRDDIPRVMEQYFQFISRIVDLRTSDEDELISVTDGVDMGLHVEVKQLGKRGKPGEDILNMNYLPAITEELRIYVMGGNDRVVVSTVNSPIRLRIIDSTGTKSFDFTQASHSVRVYGLADSISFPAGKSNFSTHVSKDTASGKFVRANPYNVWTPLITGDINRDDGFLLGLGFRYTGHDGFRQLPYSNMQEVMVTHSFKTNAFRIDYYGQWMSAIGKADITLNAIAEAPDNTMNFFGQGNTTNLDKSGDYHRYYRARFDLYEVSSALRWHTGAGTTLSVGPSVQYYHLSPDANAGRSVSQPGLITSYDSASYNRNKLHLGGIVTFISDKRDNKILPAGGYYLDLKLSGYAGVNSDARSFGQLKPEFTWYQKVDSAAVLVFSDRIGGGISVGNPAFYQSMFLGGQGNLLGYLQNRFAGRDMVYNNLQFRLRLANIAGYILPGQLGITGFYDTGRVWVSDDHSDKWHQGAGGGLYFVPASLTVIQVLAGHSSEGWYPYISLNFRL
ncbi:MAG: hypothetical protein JWP37_1921 [Mucilaginibacter sp.]|nr:hypothetical protein [Mucilaginibacter sp.]